MNLEEVVRNVGSEEVLSQLLGLRCTDDRSNLHYCTWSNPKSWYNLHAEWTMLHKSKEKQIIQQVGLHMYA